MALDKDKLKEVTAGRARRDRAGSTARDTKAADALGTRRPLALTWPDGSEAKFTIHGLDVNDLCEVEQEYGSAEGFLAVVQAGRMTAVRYLLWLVLRKGDPRLSAEERNACRYQLTVQEAGALIAAHPDALAALTNEIMAGSGLIAEEGDPGNGETPAATESTGS